MLFQQLALKDFSYFGSIRMETPLALKELMALALDEYALDYALFTCLH